MASSEICRDLNPMLSKENMSQLAKADENALTTTRSGSGSGTNSGNDSGHDSGHDSGPNSPGVDRRPSFGLNFLSSFTNNIRPQQQRNFMSNSPTIANFNTVDIDEVGHSDSQDIDTTMLNDEPHTPIDRSENPNLHNLNQLEEPDEDRQVDQDEHHEADRTVAGDLTVDNITNNGVESEILASGDVNNSSTEQIDNGKDKDGFFSVRLTPLIDHSSSNSGLYFAPVIRKAKSTNSISIGRYTEKNKAAAHAPQGSNAPIVFKSKVVSRTHALFQCNEEGQWFIKDCKSSSGTFLNHIRLSPASQESTLMPLIDGDIIQLGMDYRGGTEEVYRCVKMRCEFNKSWQRKVNQFNLEIHQKLKNLSVKNNLSDLTTDNNPINNALKNDELSECAICLLKLEPCQALFISPCSHSWHYKCIRPIIIKSYPQFYCPNCRSMCDLETDIESD